MSTEEQDNRILQAFEQFISREVGVEISVAGIWGETDETKGPRVLKDYHVRIKVWGKNLGFLSSKKYAVVITKSNVSPDFFEIGDDGSFVLKANTNEPEFWITTSSKDSGFIFHPENKDISQEVELFLNALYIKYRIP